MKSGSAKTAALAPRRIPLELFDDDYLDDPYGRYAQWRDHSPIWYDEIFDSWILTRHEDVRQVFMDPETFSQLGALEGPVPVPFLALLHDDPPRHTKLRALVSRAFTTRALQHMEGRVADLAQQLVDELPETGPVDVAQSVTIPLPVIVIADLMGIPAERAVDFKRWSDALTATAAMDEETRMLEIMAMAEFFQSLLPGRRESPGEDLISQLVLAKVDGESLSDEDLTSFCMLLLIAGNETTTNLISNFLHHCVGQPQIWQTLRDNPDLVETAVEEALRFDAPVQHVVRKALRDVEFHGQLIKAGQRVTILMGAANRDPDLYESPDEFRFDRGRNQHFSFGRGIHFCIGAPLGRLEAKYLVEALLRRFSGLRQGGKPNQRTESHMLRGFHHLWLEFDKAP